jgi:hypothetical protein
LRTGANAYEPLCQPERIRVNDRARVTIHVLGVSPTEACVLTSSAPSPTVVTNPASAIINNLAGLKFFDFESANTNALFQDMQSVPFTADLIFAADKTPPKTAAEKEAAEKKKKEEEDKKEQDANDKAAFDLYRQLASGVKDVAKPVYDKQQHWQGKYLADLDAITGYLVTDFRGERYTKFTPDTDPKIAAAKADAQVPKNISADYDSPPTEMDFQNLQSV